MDEFARSVERQISRARNVERFVGLIVAGGIALVAGLWIVTLSTPRSLPWVVGVGLALAGVGGIAGGIWRAVDV